MRNKIILTTLLLGLTASIASAQIINLPDANGTTFLGQTSGDYSGETTIPIGNFTGDVFPESLVTVRNYATAAHRGRLYIKTGSINGLTNQVNVASGSNIIIEGENYAWTGSRVYSVPDLNNNNYTELFATSGVNFYLIYGAATLPTTFNITDVGNTVAGRKFIGTDLIRGLQFGDFDKDGNVDMAFSGAGLAYGEAGVIYLSKLPAGPVTINAALFDNVKAKKFTNVVNGFPHSIAAVDLNNNGQTDLIFVDGSKIRLYIDGVLKSTIATSAILNAAMVFPAGDMTDDAKNDFVIAGNVYPSGFTVALVPNKETWPATMTLAIDGVNASQLKGISELNTFLSYIMVPSPYGLIIGDSGYSAGAGRVIILPKKKVWPSIYEITAAAQTDNTKIIGGLRIGTSVGYSDNMYGGIGCSAETAIFVGANAINQISNSYVARYKK